MPIADVMTRPLQLPPGNGVTTPKTVMVALSGYATDAFALRNALEIVRQFGCHLMALHVHFDAQAIVAALSASDPMGTVTTGNLVDHLMHDADERQAAAKKTFDTVCGEAGVPTDRELPPGHPSAGWLAVNGDEAKCFPSYGRCADLVLLLRPGGTEETPLDLSEAALFGCGRPVLLVPPQTEAAAGGTVVIAWKDTAETARAIAGATPFIQRAEKVLVLTAAEHDDRPDPSAERIVTALHRHNPRTALRHLPRNDRRPVDVLLDAATHAGGRLLVMGGYSHSRARETIFGGFTRTVLRAAPMPVLMAH